MIPARSLPPRPPEVTGREREAQRRDAGHAWMGRPLMSWPDEDLREDLASLEVVAFGEPRRHQDMSRPQLIRMVAELDRQLDRVRRSNR